ncbi:CoA transferase [Streptomyces bambusae]|uniref:CoA transferase n=1 Tax=Streptomyces bambusae TaxID=1550616 RepID=UPI001CFE474D|nr:CoA transferase [Streptomyces bambusae]MCB5164065.1 CoA transferase [Streptomyces bambusae]
MAAASATPPVRRPLDGLSLAPEPPAGPGAGLAADQLRLLGARPGRGDGPHLTVGGAGFAPLTADPQWAEHGATGPAAELCDEATVQAATGVMEVHGRRDGSPRGLGADYVATATGALTVQGVLAGLLAQARGGRAPSAVRTSAARAGLLAVSQYLAAAGADEGEAAELAPGGPPFTSSDGTVFELETLDPGAWAVFWRTLGAPEAAVRSGWRPFQFRYATACAPFPEELHATARRSPWERLRAAAGSAGAEVCPLYGPTREGIADGPPVRLRPYDGPDGPDHGAPDAGRTRGPRRPAPECHPPAPSPPLAGLTVLEAGRRIQAPLAAHLLGLLGADVIRIEPPGGDPLRGMPPACSGISARWLALNRGKKAEEVDITCPSGRTRLRELAAGADVFLHNWAPGKAAALGLDHEDLAVANPALVYAYTGGWAGRLPAAPIGTDFMVQARTGVGAAVRPADEPPAPSLMTLLDVLGGLLGTQAVLAGLLLRERTGRGVRADSSLLGAADLVTAAARQRAAAGGDPRPPAGFRRPLRTADGWVALADTDAAAGDPRRTGVWGTAEAVARLRADGLAATAVTRDLHALHDDPRLPGLTGRDAHGAAAVSDPWSFA